MKTESQHIADMIARGETIEEVDFSVAFEIIEAVSVLGLFVVVMAAIAFIGTAAGY